MKKLFIFLLPIAVFISWQINKPLEATLANKKLAQTQKSSWTLPVEKREIKTPTKIDIPEKDLRRMNLERLTKAPGLRSRKATNTYVTKDIKKEIVGLAPIGEQISEYQAFVTPEISSVRKVATDNNNNTENILIASQNWVWIEDEILNGTIEKWLLPKVFLEDTPSFSTNPIQPRIVSDCESHAYTLVSALRAAGWPAENVRVVLGMVRFGSQIGGHAWVQVYYNNGWLELEPSSGDYYDSSSGQLIEADGAPADYFLTHNYPVIEVWYYFNDVYFYDNESKSGNSPSNWLEKSSPSPAVAPTTPVTALPTCSLSFSPTSIGLNEASNVTWNFQNYTKGTDAVKLKCTLTNQTGTDVTGIESSGTIATSPYTVAGTETCQIFFNNSTTAACTSNNLKVGDDPETGPSCSKLSFSPTSINISEYSNLSWNFQNYTPNTDTVKIKCTLSHPSGTDTTGIEASGSIQTAPYTVAGTETCQIFFNNSTTAACTSNNLKVGDNPETGPSCSKLSFSPTSIGLNEASNVTWNFQNYTKGTDAVKLKCTLTNQTGTDVTGLESSGTIATSPYTVAGTETCQIFFNNSTTAACTSNNLKVGDDSNTKINGKCGTADRTFDYDDTSWGSYTFCSAGTPDPTSPAFPATGKETAWVCKGSNGGSNDDCEAGREEDPSSKVIVNGKCGTANRNFDDDDTSWSGFSFCSAGTPDPTSPPFPANGANSAWVCKGSNGGANQDCRAYRSEINDYEEQNKPAIEAMKSSLRQKIQNDFQKALGF